jgi:hypothetical protein
MRHHHRIAAAVALQEPAGPQEILGRGEFDQPVVFSGGGPDGFEYRIDFTTSRPL